MRQLDGSKSHGWRLPECTDCPIVCLPVHAAQPETACLKRDTPPKIAEPTPAVAALFRSSASAATAWQCRRGISLAEKPLHWAALQGRGRHGSRAQSAWVNELPSAQVVPQP